MVCRTGKQMLFYDFAVFFLLLSKLKIIFVCQVQLAFDAVSIQNLNYTSVIVPNGVAKLYLKWKI
jgi:hypothetical protein